MNERKIEQGDIDSIAVKLAAHACRIVDNTRNVSVQTYQTS